MVDILYITYQENPFAGNKAIIITQVEELLKAVSKKNKITWMILLNRQIQINDSVIEEYINHLKEYNIEVLIVNCKIRNIYTGFLRVKNIIKKHLEENDIGIIHCRGYAATFTTILAKQKNEKIIFDMRGLYPDEELINKKKPFNYLIYIFWKCIEIFNLKRSDSIVVVTTYFREYLEIRHKKINNKVKVIYNCVNTKKLYFDSEWRKKIRKDLNVEDNLLVVYCGSINDKWQSFNYTANVFKKIKEVFVNSKLLILTKDITADLSKYDLEKEEFQLKYVDNNEIFKYLSAGDIGLLVRNVNIVNAVAFPVKFAEYMACGLATILNDSMEGIKNLVDERGIVFNKDSNKIRKIVEIEKQSCINFAKEELDTTIIAHKYLEIYKELE